MAVKNSLQGKAAPKNKMQVQYSVSGVDIVLTPEIVREYLVSGDKDRVSTQEIVMFMNLCKASGLNPWAKEAYCIKYGNEPASMIVGKEAFMKRAESNENYDGYDAGIIVFDKECGEIVRRPGSFRMPEEEIVGGYATVWRKDRKHPYSIEVSFDEYAGRKKDGSLNRQWASKPATMIRKVALVQALREAFPSAFGGMYSAEESGYTEAEGSAAYIMTNDDTAIPIEQHEEMPRVDTVQMQQTESVVTPPPVMQETSDGQQAFF